MGFSLITLLLVAIIAIAVIGGVIAAVIVLGRRDDRPRDAIAAHRPPAPAAPQATAGLVAALAIGILLFLAVLVAVTGLPTILVAAILGLVVIVGVITAVFALARRAPRPPEAIVAHRPPPPAAPRATSGGLVALVIGLLLCVVVVVPVFLYFFLSLAPAPRDPLSRSLELASPAGTRDAPVLELRSSVPVATIDETVETTTTDGDPGPAPPRELEIGGKKPAADAGFAFSYHAPDPFEAWKRSFEDFEEWEVAARHEGVPSWVLEAGGTTYERREIPDELSIWCRFPGESGVVVGYSTVEIDDADARRAATRSAVDQLRGVLLWELRDRSEVLAEAMAPKTNGEVFEEAAELAEHLIYDRLETLPTMTHLQTTQSRLAGRVVRAAMRIDVDADARRTLVAALEQGLETNELERIRKRQQLATDIFSALGLALCIFLLYCFLNAGTKGHFAWPLRVISITALIAIYIVAFAS